MGDGYGDEKSEKNQEAKNDTKDRKVVTDEDYTITDEALARKLQKELDLASSSKAVPDYAPPTTPYPGRAHQHTNKLIEASKIRARDEVRPWTDSR